MIHSIVDIARSAGKAILEYYTKDIGVDKKEDNSPLTKADLAAHDIILKELQALTPEIPVISEEGGLPSFEQRKLWSRFWMVDPLDGTKEFIKRNGEFTVNIALIEEGIPVLGVVHLPDKDITYTGQKGAGAFKIDHTGTDSRIYSAKPDKSGSMKVVVSRSHGSDRLDEELEKKNIVIGEKLKAGSSLKFCLLAEGVADIYPRMGPTMEWDTAAGDAVFRYSGKDAPRHSPLKYNKEHLKNKGFIIGLE